jgi:hypothetical protein
MDQPGNAAAAGRADSNWIGRIIIAVILGEAIWGLLVSLMNNVVVPWLGDLMGSSSSLPTSFTQRPYNYPELFVSLLELCVAGLAAAVLNYFFQRQGSGKVKPPRSSPYIASVEPVRPASPTSPRLTEPVAPPAPKPQVAPPQPPPPQPPKLEAIAPQAAPPPVSPDLASRPEPVAASPAAPAPPAPSVAPVTAAPNLAPKPPAPAPTPETAKPRKQKAVYYNIVGEPVSSDDD